MVSKYIFEQLGAEIGDGIFNGHLPLLNSLHLIGQKIFPVQSESRVKVLGHSPGVCGRFVACSKRAHREKVRENHRGLFTAGPPF